MFIVLKMLQSLDGSIAKNIDDKLDWGSSQDKKDYKKITTEFGCVIVGSSTFEQMPKIAFKNRFVVILTRDKLKYEKYLDNPNFVFMEPSPKQVINYLEKKGFDKAVLAGGGMTNNLFLQEDLVDELHITLAPKAFASPTRVFGRIAMDKNLELLSCRQSETGQELFLKYKVIK